MQPPEIAFGADLLALTPRGAMLWGHAMISSSRTSRSPRGAEGAWAAGLSLLGFALAALSPAPAGAARTGRATIPIAIRVADPQAPVVDSAWIEEQLRWANRVFEPTGLSFEAIPSEPLPAGYRRLRSRRDRDRLERHHRGGVVNCFVVQRMHDLSDPSELRRGVHWHPIGPRDKHYLILTTLGPRTTLAHELGHYFGNRAHSQVPGNIMSYAHGREPRFDPRQIERVRTTARALLVGGRLFTLGGLERLRRRLASRRGRVASLEAGRARRAGARRDAR
ncbi:MAG: hypothetical protein OEY14_08185 [Myxococcales bacterium]|nr:hypothetical protein [Myxococcales bacterium]